MTRSIFSRDVKMQILKRAEGLCECGCGMPFDGDVHYDHYPVPAAYGGPATVDNGRVLRVRCHIRITAKVDVPRIAKARRINEKRLGLREKKSSPMAGTKRSGWRKKFDGTVERR